MNHKEFGLSLIYEIICGEGHLWYLPMLFGCFVIAHFTKDANKPFVLLIVAFVVSAFSRCPNIFRISQIAYYFFYFYVGLFVYNYRELIINYVSLRNNPKKIIMGGNFCVVNNAVVNAVVNYLPAVVIKGLVRLDRKKIINAYRDIFKPDKLLIIACNFLPGVVLGGGGGVGFTKGRFIKHKSGNHFCNITAPGHCRLGGHHLIGDYKRLTKSRAVYNCVAL